MVSLKDIAQRCGVSTATVSKALHDQKDIGAETKNRIKKIAKEMGYFPNAAAENSPYSDFCSLIQKAQCGSPVRSLCHNILFLRSSYFFLVSEIIVPFKNCTAYYYNISYHT